jgi:hypothetical protein
MLLFQGKSGFKVYRPQGQWVEPLKCRRREDTQKLIALFRGVIEKKSVVSATDGDRKVLEASAKAHPLPEHHARRSIRAARSEPD